MNGNQDSDLWAEYDALCRLADDNANDGGEMIHVFLDGSTRGDYVSYAGVYGDPPTISAFSHLWKMCLNKHGLSYFRMVEAMNLQGEFAKKGREWGSEAAERRAALLNEFAGFFELTRLGASTFAVNVGGLAEKQQAFRKRELFQQVVGQVLPRIDQRYSQIALLCDTEQDAADYFRRWLDNLQQRDEASRRIVLLGFARSTAFHALQLADMLAYLTREEVERASKSPEQPSE